MPENEQENGVVQNGQPPVQNETVTAHLMQIMGANRYRPTEAQVDKMLALQEKGMDYTYNERTKFNAPLIYNLIIILIIIVSAGAAFVFTAIKIPQYLDVVIAGLISFLTGGAGGYGLGRSQSRKDLPQE